ncbi:MAG: alginate export family protein [Planctomycetales bacterium]|nr:alginate export family protein [Planctomycetales bacterium]
MIRQFALAVLAITCGLNTAVAQQPTPAAPQTSLPPAVTIDASAPCECCQPKSTCNCPQCTKKKREAAKAKAAKAYAGVFYANDFSYLSDPCYCDHLLFDDLKRMSMPGDGKLDIGGQMRLRGHHEQGMKGAQRFLDNHDTFLLSRVRLFANYQVNENVRFFAETLYADSAGQNFAPRAIDENDMDVQNFLLDLRMTEEWSILVGRQELLYGAQRTVSPLDWANTRRTFEGVRGRYKSGDWTVDTFFTAIVPVVRGKMDSADWQQPFYGVYSTFAGLERSTLDLYYLGADIRAAGVDSSLHTLGSRLNGKTESDLLYEIEGGVQFGSRDLISPAVPTPGRGHGEWFLTGGVGHAFSDTVWTPTVWAYMDYASRNYNQLYPLAHKYLGFIDAVQRTNILSPNLLVTMNPQDRMQLLFWYYYFMTPHTGNARGIGNQYAQNPGSRDLGHELDILCNFRVTPRVSFATGYSHFWRGDKILNPADADFVYSQLQWDF